MNHNNYAFVSGRLAKDPQVLENKDRYKNVRVVVAAQDNLKNSKGERGTQFITLERFYNKGQEIKGVLETSKTGDAVSFMYEVRNNNYTDKDGNAVYDYSFLIQSAQYAESKSAADARHAKAEEVAEV